MSLDLSMLVRRVADLARRLDEMPALRWGTVVTSSPLTVRLDGDTDATGGLESLTGTLALGARVLVVRWNRRGVVLGSPSRRGQVVVQSGTVDVDSLSTTIAAIRVTFPTAFASAPTVATSQDITPGGVVTNTNAVTVTASGFSLRHVSTAAVSGTRAITWVAVGTA